MSATAFPEGAAPKAPGQHGMSATAFPEGAAPKAPGQHGMIDLGLRGKRAVVSGAGYIASRAGHGRYSALRLAEAGARVACVDIDEGRAEAIAEEIAAAGGSALPIVADMTDRAQVERALDRVVEEFGGIDICVDIIGMAVWERSVEATDEAWTWSIENNLTHVFLLYRAAGRRMIAQGTGGALVAITSVDGTVAARFHAAYGAAKAGVISLTRTFADELGAHGIRVNAVAPGNVGSGNDDQPADQWAVNEINPLAAPRARDIADGVLFLCSDLAARVTGHTLVVDGGATIRSVWDIDEPRMPSSTGEG
jgi:NAD(P)-dependent dehydrogenase (short-subunit alcohol dehydrogenase family)